MNVEDCDTLAGGALTRSFHTLVFAIIVAAATLGLCRESNAGGPVTIGTGVNSSSASSPLGGAHAGYNWQNGLGVFGFETDFSAMRLDSSMVGGLSAGGVPLPPPAFTNTSASIDWYGTFRGRFGVTSGPLLFYGTGGLAYGNVELNSAMRTSVGLPLNSQTSAWKAGWVGGGGIEYICIPNLVFTLGYQFVDLGSVGLAASMPAGAAGRILTQSATAQAHFQTILAGFSWQFGPTGSAPWQGAYAGVHVGGAWGLPTSASYSSQ
jgi:outer membrane immunogenic protein